MPDIMNNADIAFPHLGIYLRNVPKQFTVFNYTITLYAVIITIGVLLAVKMCEHVAKMCGHDGEIYWDIYLPLVFLSVLGARIYYVIFSWDLYRDNPISVLYIHQGGLAIYGGVLTGFAVLFAISKIKKRPFLELSDMVMHGLLVGQILGRWGNFTNREVFGQYTDNLFAMRLPIAAVRPGDISESISEQIIEGTNYIQVHPTFLYESCWNLVLLILMLLYVKVRYAPAIRAGSEAKTGLFTGSFEGEMTLIYLGGYGLGRAIIEGIRTDQLLIPGTQLAVSQLLGGFLLFFAIVMDIATRIRLKNAPRPAEAEKTVELSAESGGTEKTNEASVESGGAENIGEATAEHMKNDNSDRTEDR